MASRCKNILKQLIKTVLAQGFDIDFRKTWLADAYVDYDKNLIVIGDNKEISLFHECLHVLYDEVLDEPLSEKKVEEDARRILSLARRPITHRKASSHNLHRHRNR